MNEDRIWELDMPFGQSSPPPLFSNSNSETVSLISLSELSLKTGSSSATLEAAQLPHLGFPSPWHNSPTSTLCDDLRDGAPSRAGGHRSPSWTSALVSPTSLTAAETELGLSVGDVLGPGCWDTTRWVAAKVNIDINFFNLIDFLKCLV